MKQIIYMTLVTLIFLTNWTFAQGSSKFYELHQTFSEIQSEIQKNKFNDLTLKISQLVDPIQNPETPKHLKNLALNYLRIICSHKELNSKCQNVLSPEWQYLKDLGPNAVHLGTILKFKNKLEVFGNGQDQDFVSSKNHQHTNLETQQN